MADDTNDIWGQRAAGADTGPWTASPGADPADTSDFATGRWSSPSMGSYSPEQEHQALQQDDEAQDDYFEKYGYGEDFGDGGIDSSNFDEEELFAAAETRRNLIEWAVVLLGAVLLALFLRAVFVQAFYIPSESMSTTLLVNDRVLVNKLSYRLHDINRGDVIVFHRTDEEILADPSLHEDVIKRVIAFEGESIEIHDNTVFIDGDMLVEPYLDPGTINADFGPTVVPTGMLFVMGDNRQGSSDSRFQLGPIGEDRVVGRAFVRFWPLNRLGVL